MSEDNKYKSDYLSLQFYSIGGKWGYAIMRLKDSSSVEKVRLAKCKKLDEFPSTKKYEWTEVPVVHVKDLSQVQKINFKPTDNFANLAKKIEEELAIVAETNKKNATEETTKEIKGSAEEG